MKVLIVKKKDSCWPFVEEQVDALFALNAEGQEPKLESRESISECVEFAWHLIEGKGMFAYFKDALRLIREIHKEKPDVIHAHYGISGYYVCLVVLLMGLKKDLPVVVTYHGSDINVEKVRRISRQAIRMADYNIFVSPKLMELVEHGENSQVIPCGLNMKDWMPMDKKTARTKLGLNVDKKYVLFSSDFQTEVKNPELAQSAICNLNSKMSCNDIELIELKGYTREQVNMLMHAVDVCLMTSKTEGSPQFIKEAMVCGCPIVTTRVGDAESVIGKTEGCFFTDYTVENCAKQLGQAIKYAKLHDRTKGRERIMQLGYDNREVAQKIKKIYWKVVYGVLI